MIQFFVDEESQGMRLDLIISKHKLVSSRSEATKLIHSKQVKINGLNKVLPKSKPNISDSIEFTPFIPESPVLEAVDHPLDIVFEDGHLIVLNKPSGMVVHPAAGHSNDTLVNYLLFHTQLSKIGPANRPGIVHRLDKDTSGLLLVAKENESHTHLSDQFSKHSIGRSYLALVWGKVSTPQGKIDQPLARHPVNRKKRAIVSNGKHAVTHWKTVESFEYFTLLECRLETGRTHQIRVHLASIGHSIVGDPLYGRKRNYRYIFGIQVYELIDQYKGQALHAAYLSFEHPQSQKRLHFSKHMPEEMKNIIHQIRIDELSGNS